MHKFTPGPWKYKSGEVGTISDYDDQSYGMLIPHADVFGEDKIANGLLISAAPDLLEALQDIVDTLNSGFTVHETSLYHLNARKAIAKALGEE